MSDQELIEDSQSDNSLDNDLSWNFVEIQKKNAAEKSKKKVDVITVEDKSSRKAKQMDKLLKDLTPLSSGFEEIPKSRIRHSSFEKSNQFTVVAAEFLKLSDANELNMLFQQGYSKSDIEDMLEHKYQLKKEFFTELNVKHHNFKRKSFESWRTLSNSHGMTNNTFKEESDLLAQLTRREQNQLKRINERTLVKSMNKKLKLDAVPDAINDEKIPNETSLLTIPTQKHVEKYSRLDRRNDTSILPKKVSENDYFENNNKDAIYIDLEPVTETSKFMDIADSTEDVTLISQTNTLSKKKKEGLEEQNKDPEFELQNTKDELEDLFGLPNDEEPALGPTKMDSPPAKIPSSLKAIENKKEQFDPPDAISTIRQLRHRTIVNTNPYLVDRAEILGLSTRYELSEMTEDGKSDSEILKFLDQKYQEIKKSKKTKGHSLGLFSKSSFYEIMDGPRSQNALLDVVSNLNNSSDGEFEISDDELNELPDNDEFTEDFLNDYTDNVDFLNAGSHTEDFSVSDIHRDYQRLAPKKRLPTNILNTGMNKTGIEKGTSFKNKRYKESEKNNKSKISLSSKADNDPPKYKPSFERTEVIDEGTPLKRSIIDVSTSDGIKNPIFKRSGFVTDNSKEETQPRKKQNINTSFNPYSTELLSFPDEDIPSVFRKRKLEKMNKHLVDTQSSKLYQSQILASNVLKSKNMKTSVTSNSPKNVGADRAARSKNTTNSVWNTKGRKELSSRNLNGDIIASLHAPRYDSTFEFSRPANTGSFQEYSIQTYNVGQNKPFEIVQEIDLNNARNIMLPIEKPNVTNNFDLEKNSKLKQHVLSDIYTLLEKSDVDKRRIAYHYILQIRPIHFDSIKIPQPFLQSDLLSNVFDMNTTLYLQKRITIKFLTVSFVFEVPLSPGNTESQLRAFFDLLLNFLEGNDMSKSMAKSLRKCLINIIKLLFNIKKDCSHILPNIGLAIGNFWNLYKKFKLSDQELTCFIAPYFLLYMTMIQNFLDTDSTENHNFLNTSKWLQKKIILSFCTIPFQNVIVKHNSIVLEALEIFFKHTKNPWPLVNDTLLNRRSNPLNVLIFCYFCNSHQKLESNWTYFLTKLSELCDVDDSDYKEMEMQTLDLFVTILKVNRELKWPIDSQIPVEMFKLLAKIKFGSNFNIIKKPSLFPGIPATDAILPEDGVTDIYFKVLNNYVGQYLPEETKFMVEKLIPTRPTTGYNDAQLHNRAKVLLVTGILFDKDLITSLEAILTDLLKQNSLYAIKCALGFMKTVITQLPRKRYNIIKKNLPYLITKMNSTKTDDETMFIFNELVASVVMILNGQEISYLKRSLDFFNIILQFKANVSQEGFVKVLDESFQNITNQFEFLIGIERSNKENQSLNKKLCEIVETSKEMLKHTFNRGIISPHYLKYWLYCSHQLGKPAIQLYYTEWNYFLSAEFRDKLGLVFFSSLLQYFDVCKIKTDVLTYFFKQLPVLHVDLSSLLQGILRQNLINLQTAKFRHVSSSEFDEKRGAITIACLSSLLNEKDEQMVYRIVRDFIISMKASLAHSISRNFIKQIAIYLYDKINDRFEIAEWDLLVNVLKINLEVRSLSQKLQYVDSEGEFALTLEKAYINAIASGKLDEFLIEVKTIYFHRIWIDALTKICTFHANYVVSGEFHHWFHLNKWVSILVSFFLSETQKTNLPPLLKLLKGFSVLKTLDPEILFKFEFYHLELTNMVYDVLEWLLKMFVGFEDFSMFQLNFWKFAAIDTNVENKENFSFANTLHNFDHGDLKTLYIRSHDLLKNKVVLINDAVEMCKLESKIDLKRKALKSNWSICFNN